MQAVRLIKPTIAFDEVEAEFRAVFESGVFTRGANVDAFSDEIARYTGSQYAFLTTSATTALWVCLKLMGVGPGDEVAVSDFSFPATANVVEDLGATPVFVDVDIDSFNMSAAGLEQKITPRTRAVVFVDALGSPTGLHAVKAVCEQYNLPLIEDAACAIGSAEMGRRCGNIADVTCFSFHPRKLLNTGEGGAITTNRQDWADWLRVKLAHGADGFRGPGLDFIEFGYNFRLPELQAIMGRKQLARLDAVIDQRNVVRADYIEGLEPLGFIPQYISEETRHNVQSMVFRVPEHLGRDQLIDALKGDGLESTLGTYCLSGTTYFSKKYHDVQPNSATLEGRTITLPCYDGVPTERVIAAIARHIN